MYQTTNNELIYDSRYSAINAIDPYETRFINQQQQFNDPYNDNGNYGTFMPANGAYPQQRVLISRQQLQQQGYLRTRSPSIDSRTKGKLRRRRIIPTIKNFIKFICIARYRFAFIFSI